MKRTTLYGLVGLLTGIAACCALLRADAAPGETQTTARTDRDFDDGWRFHRGDFANASAPGFDDSSWQNVTVPHDWSSEGPFGPENGSGNGYAPGGIGWYRKRFPMDAAQQGKHVEIQFDGVYDNSEVWINGQFVGRRPDGYSSFHYDLTPFLKFGGENVLAVRVDHSRYADSRWYTGSGIYRHVRLRLASPLHIETWGTFVSTPKISKASADARIETTVVNSGAAAQAFVLHSEVLSADGSVVATNTASGHLDAGQSRALTQTLRIAKPALWSPESPNLYTVRSQVRVGGSLADDSVTPFGIRTVQFDPNRGLQINGKTYKMKGVCIHHDAGSLGAAVPDAVLERRLRLLQELGVNAIRTSHNPPAPELLDLCDRLGLLVMDEAFDEWTPSKNKWVQGRNIGEASKFGYAEFFREWSVRDIQDMVRRDRSHPSIILWSIGNEIDYPNDPFSHPILGDNFRPQNPRAENMTTLARPLIDAVKELDRTRPVTAALAAVNMSDAVGLGEMLDIVGYNYQESRYPEDHKKFPHRVLYGSENGHAYSNWVAVRDNAYVSGQFLWTGIDYLGEANAWPNRASGAGLLDLCGFKKPQAWFRQSLWSETPMVYLCASPSGSGDGARRRPQESWNWTPGSTVSVSCYTNCPEVRLTLNGENLGVKRQSDAVDGVLTWPVPFAPGTLRAEAVRDGKPVASFVLQTADAGSRLLLIPDKTTLRADGKDVVHVEFRVVDAQGVRVPDAALPVTFALSGPAALLGLGNGDTSDPNSGKGLTHATWQGRGLAVLQSLLPSSAAAPGPVTLTATAPGLPPVTLTLASP